MKIKYLGPSPSVNVGEFGPHPKDVVIDYPDDVAEELLATSKKQKFERADSEDRPPATPEEILEASKKVIKAGAITQDGKPKVEAIESILGKSVTAQARDEAWENIKAENKGDE